VTDEQPQDPWIAQPTVPLSYEPETSRKAAHRAPPEGLRSRWRRLPILPKLAVIVAGLVLLGWAGFGLVGLVSGSSPSSDRTPSGNVAPHPTPQSSDASPMATTGPPALTTAATTQPPEPVIEKRIVTETRTIAFDTTTVHDNDLPKGTRTVRTNGVPGIRTLSYEVTLTDGVQTAKRLVRSVVTREPVTQVIAIGTKPGPKCDPPPC
jgi:resuscitation-promoting factor RpfB